MAEQQRLQQDAITRLTTTLNGLRNGPAAGANPFANNVAGQANQGNVGGNNQNFNPQQIGLF